MVRDGFLLYNCPMELLGKLFGNQNRVKLLRLFLFNPETSFRRKDIARRAKVAVGGLNKELKLLETIKLIKAAGEDSRTKSWRFNPRFPVGRELKLLLDTEFGQHRSEISARFRGCGQIRLLVIAGNLIGDLGGKVDLVIVGDGLRKGTIEQTVRVLEAEAGKELVYALFETKDFLYRLEASDKFVRDLLDYEHEKLINKLKV